MTETAAIDPTTAATWDEILSYARWYPSPHNSQPIKVRVDGERLELFYDLDLGLPAESYGIPFGSVCAGVFIEAVAIAAHGLGFAVDEQLDFTPMDFASRDRLHPLGTLTLRRTGEPSDDLDPELLLTRRTSRLQYEPRPVPDEVADEVRALAREHGHTLATTTERDLVERIIRINQRTLFYDLEDPGVRAEIQGYLRYSEREAKRSRDGLSARCLAFPGLLLRLFMGHYWVWKLPVVSAVLRQIYLRSMRGVSQVAWIKGPFADERDYTTAGRVVLRVWLALERRGVQIHPFGSVITNPRAHRELVELLGEHEGEDMIWMLFRLGYSKRPPQSQRRELADMVIG